MYFLKRAISKLLWERFDVSVCWSQAALAGWKDYYRTHDWEPNVFLGDGCTLCGIHTNKKTDARYGY